MGNVEIRPKMELPTKCCKTGCTNASSFQPVLCIWAKGDWKRRPNACIRMELGLTICTSCAKNAKATDFICDDGWEQIVHAIVNVAGRADPSRESAVLELKPLPWCN